METLKRILGLSKGKDKDKKEPVRSIEGQIVDEHYKRLRERVKNPKYPKAPWNIIDGLLVRTDRRTGEMVPVRAKIDLIPDTRRKDALAAKDMGILDLQIGRMLGDLEVKEGTLGVIIDVYGDDFEDCYHFLITWMIFDSEKNEFYCSYVPTVSFVPGERYEELDFSLINKGPKEIGEEFANFVEKLQEERRRRWL